MSSPPENAVKIRFRNSCSIPEEVSAVSGQPITGDFCQKGARPYASFVPDDRWLCRFQLFLIIFLELGEEIVARMFFKEIDRRQEFLKRRRGRVLGNIRK